MKSDSELMNELAHKTNYLHEMTSSESSAMKRALLDIYRDVAKLCEKEGLTLMLSGGSCLGAVRHKGFIPWDDDLDVMMRRDDYERLIRLCKEGRLGDKYEFDLIIIRCPEIGGTDCAEIRVVFFRYFGTEEKPAVLCHADRKSVV